MVSPLERGGWSTGQLLHQRIHQGDAHWNHVSDCCNTFLLLHLTDLGNGSAGAGPHTPKRRTCHLLFGLAPAGWGRDRTLVDRRVRPFHFLSIYSPIHSNFDAAAVSILRCWSGTFKWTEQRRIRVNSPDIPVGSGQLPFLPMADFLHLLRNVGKCWFGAPRWTLPQIIWIIRVSISNRIFAEVAAHLSIANKKWNLGVISLPMELCRNKVGHSKRQPRSTWRWMQFIFIHLIPFLLFRSTSSKWTTNSHPAPHRPTISTISARKSNNCRNMTTPSDYKVKTSPVPSHICKWVYHKLFPSFSYLNTKQLNFYDSDITKRRLIGVRWKRQKVKIRSNFQFGGHMVTNGPINRPMSWLMTQQNQKSPNVATPRQMSSSF